MLQTFKNECILAHVKITFDGGQGSIHIDIIPMQAPAELQKTITAAVSTEALPGSGQSNSQENMLSKPPVEDPVEFTSRPE